MIACTSITACALTAGDSPSVTPSPEATAPITTNSIAPSSSSSTRETSTSTVGHPTTSIPTAADIGAEDSPQQSQGASGSTVLVGGVVGVLSGGALVLVLVLVLVILCVKRSRRKLVQQEGITNVLYGGGHMES